MGQKYKRFQWNGEAWELMEGDVEWRYVGTSGEPSFENGWLNYGASWGDVRFRKHHDGLVELQGLARDGSQNSSVFTLPVGYRPNQNLIFTTATYDSTVGIGYTFRRLDIGSDGSVKVNETEDWVTLSGIVFYADQ